MKEGFFAYVDLDFPQIELEQHAQSHCSDTTVRPQCQQISLRVSVFQKIDGLDYFYFTIIFSGFYFTTFDLKLIFLIFCLGPFQKA